MTSELHPVEKEQVMAFLDGELEPKLAAEVAAHIEACPNCRILRDDLRGVSAQMLAWSVELASAKLAQVVNAEAQAKPSDKVLTRTNISLLVPLWRRFIFNRLTWAAACLLVFGGIAFITLNLAKMKPAAPSESFSSINAQSEEVSPQAASTPVPGPPPTPSRGRSPQFESKTGDVALNDATQDLSACPMIARTASLKVSVRDVDSARAAVDKIIQQFHGYAASLTIHSEAGSPRSIESEVHIPAQQSDAALTAFKTLGRVEQEEQGGEEVTTQVIDLDARLKNARESESRLQDILRTRTGKVSDILEVEKVISETRENIERMEAEQKELRGRVSYSSIKLELHEEYQAKLGEGTSVGRQIRNAIVDGFQSAGSGALDIFVWLLSAGPSLILAALILFLPARWAWRKYGKNWKDWMERQRSAHA
jgi:hypothetical protein